MPAETTQETAGSKTGKKRQRLFGSSVLCPPEVGYALYEYRIEHGSAALHLVEDRVHCAKGHVPTAIRIDGLSIQGPEGYERPLFQGDLVVVCCSPETATSSRGSNPEDRDRLMKELDAAFQEAAKKNPPAS